MSPAPVEGSHIIYLTETEAYAAINSGVIAIFPTTAITGSIPPEWSKQGCVAKAICPDPKTAIEVFRTIESELRKSS